MRTSPLSVQIEITDVCNHQCAHCYHLDVAAAEMRKIAKRRELNLKSLLVIGERLVEANVFNVVLTGGEPLTRKRDVVELALFFATNEVNCSLNTNLTLLTPEVLTALKNARLSGILTSCPSTREDVYKAMTGGRLSSFLEKLRLVLDSQLPITVNMVVNQLNAHLVRETGLALSEMGVSSFAASPMTPNLSLPVSERSLGIEGVRGVLEDLKWLHGATGMKVDTLESLPKCLFDTDTLDGDWNFTSRSCQAGRATMAIGCQGEVRACTHCTVSYGSVLLEPLKRIYERMEPWRADEFVPDACRECGLVETCRGGCRTNAAAYFGSLNAPDPWMVAPTEAGKRSKYASLEIEGMTVFSASPVFRHRSEGEDAVTFFGGNFHSAVTTNKQMFDFCCDLRSNLPMTFSQIVSRYKFHGKEERLRLVLASLVKSRAIVLDATPVGETSKATGEAAVTVQDLPAETIIQRR